MTIKIYKSSQESKIVNGEPVIQQGHSISINPNNKNNVYFSSYNGNNKFFNKFDSLNSFDSFLKGIQNNSSNSIFDKLKHDLNMIKLHNANDNESHTHIVTKDKKKEDRKYKKNTKDKKKEDKKKEDRKYRKDTKKRKRKIKKMSLKKN